MCTLIKCNAVKFDNNDAVKFRVLSTMYLIGFGYQIQ